MVTLVGKKEDGHRDGRKKKRKGRVQVTMHARRKIDSRAIERVRGDQPVRCAPVDSLTH